MHASVIGGLGQILGSITSWNRGHGIGLLTGQTQDTSQGHTLGGLENTLH